MTDVPAKLPPAALGAERAKTCALSFTAGYVDTSVFVGLFGLFTAHVTGNFVLIGSELVHASGDVWPKLLAFPAFILAVAVAVKVAEALERRFRSCSISRRPCCSPPLPPSRRAIPATPPTPRPSRAARSPRRPWECRTP
jgi:hypothetical protein